jgi:hypothetical protein
MLTLLVEAFFINIPLAESTDGTILHIMYICKLQNPKFTILQP